MASPLSTERASGFELSLSNFEGPFDLLLSLIAKHELSITEVALSRITDEFSGYLKQLTGLDEMYQASEFVVVAATLLDLKIASLLPKGEVVDAEDVAVLEARDLLFARLLQYRAFKDVSAWFAAGFDSEQNRMVREVKLEERFKPAQKELVWTTTLEEFAGMAVMALTPKVAPTIGLGHLHVPQVSIRDQAKQILTRLKTEGRADFRSLLGELADRPTVVARFLAVLELYRVAAIGIEVTDDLGSILIVLKNQKFDTESLANLGAEFDG
ncbi:MAG: ScpA family protein [Actinomycetes bacterium]